MRTLLAAAVAGVFLMAVANACNDNGPSPDSDNPTSSDSGTRSPCSTGPAYDAATQFADGTPATTANEQCVPRCGTTAADGPASVPSGACSFPGETCDISVSYFCAPSGSLGHTDGLTCACTGGQWACVRVAQGTGACAPNSDAGAH